MVRPQFEYIPGARSRALIYKVDRDIWPVYHYHPEIDLLLVLKNRGEYISGDHIGRMEPGTLIMNGPNIPHALHPSEADEGDWERPALVVLQFAPATLGEDMLAREEMEGIRQFLDRDADRGFEFLGETRRRAKELMLGMRDMDDFERILAFLRLLRMLSLSTERRQLASQGYTPSLRDKDIDRMDAVVRHIQKHKHESIPLEAMARLAGMSPKSFCRFFKNNTGKTLVQYVNELRVAEACKLLLESDLPVTEICFEVGFNNVSNFNRRFRDFKGVAPRQFRRDSRLDAAKQRRALPVHRVFGG